MFSIGEFSKVSGLSVKALRLYHQESILIPRIVDRDTGYRYYDFDNIEQARVVSTLRSMMFSLEQIRAMLSRGDDADVVSTLEAHRREIEAKLRQMRDAASSLDSIIRNEREAQDLARKGEYQIEEISIQPMIMAGIRIKGRYTDVSDLFGRLVKTLKSSIAGKPFTLFYDSEFKDEDADFECCFPIKKLRSFEGIDSREIEGGQALSLVHRGPFAAVGRSYARLFSHLSERGLQAKTPSREVYLKGPGVIFRGNPKAYLTQLQCFVGPRAAAS